MTKLSMIDAEARRLVGRAPEAEQRAFQMALIACCEKYWESWRGPEPSPPLARTLWSVTPPLAELFLDMDKNGDAHLADLLAGLSPARALAALVLAEIERGNAEGIHLAYEAMMLFETPQAGRIVASGHRLGRLCATDARDPDSEHRLREHRASGAIHAASGRTHPHPLRAARAATRSRGARSDIPPLHQRGWISLSLTRSISPWQS